MQLPLFIKGSEIRCLVIGGGQIAERKVDTLLQFDVSFCLVAKEIRDSLQAKLQQSAIVFETRSFHIDDLSEVDWVVCATSNTDLNSDIAAECKRRHILVNVVDNGELSSVTFPSIVDRNPVVVAISTDGHSPTLASRLRSQLETQLSTKLGRLAEFLRDKRQNIEDVARKRVISNEVIDSDILRLLEGGREEQAERVYEEIVSNLPKQLIGLVSLVGGGPGDPELLTLKALHALERADIVYYDNLVSEEVLSLVRKDATRVYVGKKRRYKGIRQEEINRLLFESAQAGQRVVRLKGGDPFLFGRGGEELEFLAEQGIDVEVIPGITAALGCAAYAGIPLTHRDYSQSVRFVTGHLKSNEINLEWPELAREGQTLVVYMGLANLKVFTKNLLENGMDTDMPIAVISKGSLPDQVVVKGTLTSIHETVDQQKLQSPTTAIIGRVVGFRGLDN